MFSYVELLIAILVAALFILMFKAQRKFFIKAYHSGGELIEGKVSIRNILIRYLMITVFCMLLFFLNFEVKVIILGTGIGSFLIVWPAFIFPYIRSIITYTFFQKLLYYCYLVLFPIASIVVAYFATRYYAFGISTAQDIIKNFVYSIILFVILGGSESKLYSWLNSSIIKHEKNMDDEIYYFDDDEDEES